MVHRAFGWLTGAVVAVVLLAGAFALTKIPARFLGTRSEPAPLGACYTDESACSLAYEKSCIDKYDQAEAFLYPYWVGNAVCIERPIYLQETGKVFDCDATGLAEAEQQCLTMLNKEIADPLLQARVCRLGEDLEIVYPQKILKTTFDPEDSTCTAYCGAVLRCASPPAAPKPQPLQLQPRATVTPQISP